jgi:hypothetical protein
MKAKHYTPKSLIKIFIEFLRSGSGELSECRKYLETKL